MEQISAFKLSTELSAIYHYQMNIKNRQQPKKIDLIKHFGQEAFWPKLISPWDLHTSKQQEVYKLRRGLSFSGHPFPFHKR